jgi:hypothetical protein
MRKKYVVNSALYGTTQRFTSRVRRELTCSEGAKEESSLSTVYMFLISATNWCAVVLVAFGVTGGVTVRELTGVVDLDNSAAGFRSVVAMMKSDFDAFVSFVR